MAGHIHGADALSDLVQIQEDPYHDGTTGWKDRLEKEGIDWQEWKYSSDDIKKAKDREKDLPAIEVGHFYWQPSWSKETLMFPMVVKRTWTPHREEKKDGQKSLFAPDTVKDGGVGLLRFSHKLQFTRLVRARNS